MRFGFAVLRLSSAEFWAMTPRELAAAMGGAAIEPSKWLDRRRLTELLQRYPDRSDKQPPPCGEVETGMSRSGWG